MMSRSRAALALLGAVALSACSQTQRASSPAPADRSARPRPEAPDQPAEEGVPPEGGRPRIPAGPEALLAAGAIGELQRALSDRGFLGAHRDGELDEATSGALRKFQESEELAATGFPDRETLQRLGIDPERAYGRGQAEDR